eukprot:8486102-Pyramimonas_sp.AAC.1
MDDHFSQTMGAEQKAAMLAEILEFTVPTTEQQSENNSLSRGCPWLLDSRESKAKIDWLATPMGGSVVYKTDGNKKKRK